MPRIVVLRVGHRVPRDSRVTTHVALVGRAFGADEIWVDKKDGGLERRVKDVVERFGGSFRIRTGVGWRRSMREWKGRVVHLTMYGEPLDEALAKIPSEDLLIIVGAQKVPGEVFEMADFNVAVGNQPHSEVAALALFLDRLLGGEGLRREFSGSITVVPSARGKVVEEDAT
ncbi:MAG: tRNA (cytidine(56)-2'-O)-methyltransferase [Candidatus Thermoplasmatota archaeon]|nr:tRNA (cytidine(56)-2'-O)-methyltransferase [Candidatus Thermoplasmatota archaeon]